MRLVVNKFHRDQRIVELRRGGMIAEDIARMFDLTRGRVTQICGKVGIQRMSTVSPIVDMSDGQAKFLAHIEASRRRDEWARRGIALAEAGKVRQAKVAQRKAQFWDARAKRLEPRQRPELTSRAQVRKG